MAGSIHFFSLWFMFVPSFCPAIHSSVFSQNFYIALKLHTSVWIVQLFKCILEKLLLFVKKTAFESNWRKFHIKVKVKYIFNSLTESCSLFKFVVHPCHIFMYRNATCRYLYLHWRNTIWYLNSSRMNRMPEHTSLSLSLPVLKKESSLGSVSQFYYVNLKTEISSYYLAPYFKGQSQEILYFFK